MGMAPALGTCRASGGLDVAAVEGVFSGLFGDGRGWCTPVGTLSRGWQTRRGQKRPPGLSRFPVRSPLDRYPRQLAWLPSGEVDVGVRQPRPRNSLPAGRGRRATCRPQTAPLLRPVGSARTRRMISVPSGPVPCLNCLSCSCGCRFGEDYSVGSTRASRGSR